MNVKTNLVFKFASAALLAPLFIGAAGCVDVEMGGPSAIDYVDRHQAVTVVPEFAITGTEAVPESLYLTELGLAISEIRLAPMTGNDSLAYTTRDGKFLRFDLARGETVQTTEGVELPAAGRYLVSIRLEPIDVEGQDETLSFSAHGFVVDENSTVGDDIGKTSDGEPQPMPFDPKTATGQLTDKEAFPSAWTPFQYHSKRALFYTFSDVEFKQGTQYLSFSFNIFDWAAGAAEPISNAVRANDTDESVDVSKQVDSWGTGAEALIETGIVRTVRRPDER